MSRRSPFWDTAMVFGAEYLIFLTFLLVLISALKGRMREKKILFLTILGITVSQVIITVTRFFYLEPRPYITYPEISTLIPQVRDAAFPSMHTTLMSVIAFSHYFYKSPWTLLFLFLAFWVGFARIFVGVHYPLDILGGLATGFISVTLAWQIKTWLKRKLTGF